MPTTACVLHDGPRIRRRDAVDRRLHRRSGIPATRLQAHVASSSVSPSRRASVARASCRCTRTVPAAMSRISAISATGRSSRYSDATHCACRVRQHRARVPELFVPCVDPGDGLGPALPETRHRPQLPRPTSPHRRRPVCHHPPHPHAGIVVVGELVPLPGARPAAASSREVLGGGPIAGEDDGEADQRAVLAPEERVEVVRPTTPHHLTGSVCSFRRSLAAASPDVQCGAGVSQSVETTASKSPAVMGGNSATARMRWRSQTSAQPRQ